MRIITYLFYFWGMVCIVSAIAHVYIRYNPQRLSFNDDVVQHRQTTRPVPTQMVIQSLGIQAPVIPGRIFNSSWETSTKGISFLVSSSLPGTRGNSIFYGHNWPNLLEDLHKIQIGEVIEIYYNNEIKVLYIVESITIVSPETNKILAEVPDDRVTLYTCFGFLDSKRLVVVGRFDRMVPS